MKQSEPKNIRAFNWLTLKVLNDLYDAFPEPKDIEGLHFTISTLFDVGPKSTEAEYLSYFTATVRWLSTEGFLRYRSDDSGNFRGLILSLKGLTILGYEPRSLRLLDKKEPLIAKIKRVVAGGTKGASEDAIKAILTKLFTLSVSALSR